MTVCGRFLWARVQTLNEKELMSELSSSLQMQLALVLNKSLFTRVPIFRDMEVCAAAPLLAFLPFGPSLAPCLTPGPVELSRH